MWSGSGTHDIDINNESDGGIKSQYWMAYFQDSTGNGCATWEGQGFNEYSHVNFHPEVSGPSPSNGGNNVGVSPDLQVDVSDAEGDDTDVEFYNASGDSSLGTDYSIPDGVLLVKHGLMLMSIQPSILGMLDGIKMMVIQNNLTPTHSLQRRMLHSLMVLLFL